MCAAYLTLHINKIYVYTNKLKLTNLFGDSLLILQEELSPSILPACFGVG